MKQENQRPLTVEDLMRLKRAERPGREFWTRFDQELRTKQLAALVKREPWWHRLAESWTFVARRRVTVGATAILALSFVTARQYHGERPSAAPLSEPRVAAAPAVVVNIMPASELADAAVLPAFTVGSADVAEPVSLETVENSKPAANRRQLVSLLNGPNAPELIGAASLAATEAAAAGVTRGMFGLSTGFDSRALPARVGAVEPSEPLANMSHPADKRRIALTHAMYAMYGQIESASRLEKPVTSKLSYDGVNEERPGRLKVGGDSGSFNAGWKF